MKMSKFFNKYQRKNLYTHARGMGTYVKSTLAGGWWAAGLQPQVTQGVHPPCYIRRGFRGSQLPLEWERFWRCLFSFPSLCKIC